VLGGGGETVLRRNVFTMEGSEKGNEVLCLTVGDVEQDEVTKWKEVVNNSSP
jgi:hypothetical protein